MCELLVVDDLRNAAFEIALQKDAEVFAVDLLADVVGDFLQDLLQEAGLIFFDIVLFVV